MLNEGESIVIELDLDNQYDDNTIKVLTVEGKRLVGHTKRPGIARARRLIALKKRCTGDISR
eukprot:2692949-Karenia_brevis.AAC.1